MNKTKVMITSLALATLFSGCMFETDAPECSSEDVTNVVKEVFIETQNKTMGKDSIPYTIESFHSIRAVSYDKEIKLRTCKAKAVFKEGMEFKIGYSVQIDETDNDNFYVTVDKTVILGLILAQSLSSSKDETSSYNTVPERPSPKKHIKKRNNNDAIGTLYPLDTFTVNLKKGSGESKYLKATMSLELDNKELELELDAKSPVIRDRILRILSSKTIEEVSTKEGKKKVSDEIVNTLNVMISSGQVVGVYFTEFVYQ